MGALLAGALLLAAAPADGTAQLRRDATIPYVPDAPGRLLVGAGAAWEFDRAFPLSGLGGDLARLGVSTLAYSFAPGAVFRVQGDVRRVLSIEARRGSAVPLDEDVEDGTTSDVGDFRLAALFRVLGAARGPSAGVHLEATLPNSDEAKGIGTNTTDVRTTLFGSWGREAFRATGEVGVAILESPVETFEQNDLVAYAAEALLRPSSAPLRVSLSVRGRANTRDLVPPGTEDRGRVRLRAELAAGPWRLDGGASRRYAGPGEDWGLELGVARVLP